MGKVVTCLASHRLFCYRQFRRHHGDEAANITVSIVKRLLMSFLKSLAIAICNGGERGIRTLVRD